MLQVDIYYMQIIYLHVSSSEIGAPTAVQTGWDAFFPSVGCFHNAIPFMTFFPNKIPDGATQQFSGLNSSHGQLRFNQVCAFTAQTV